jgi:hypothetical protein
MTVDSRWIRRAKAYGPDFAGTPVGLRGGTSAAPDTRRASVPDEPRSPRPGALWPGVPMTPAVPVVRVRSGDILDPDRGGYQESVLPESPIDHCPKAI